MLGRAATTAITAALVAGVFAAPGLATPLSAKLTSSNGEGPFDPTLGCPAGDGPSWRFAYSGAATPQQGPFGGTWTSSIAVHDAGGGHGFVPAGAGRLRVDVDRGGAAHLELDGGDCASAPLTLTADGDGDPVAQGALPLRATGGAGALRGFAGSGTATFTLELGPGADNAADVALAGDFTVLQPRLALGTPTAYWRNAGDYLAKRLSVVVPVVNAGDRATVGDAFAVQLSQATLNGRAPVSGVPATLGRVDAGSGSGATAVFAGASPGKAYTLHVRVEGTDALDAAVPAVVQSKTVRAPLTP